LAGREFLWHPLLLLKQKKLKLTKKENHELSVYEELDDYLNLAIRGVHDGTRHPNFFRRR
jgi:hypothetical protein